MSILTDKQFVWMGDFILNKKIIMTSGSFDLFHYGHLNILLQAKALGSYLCVGVSTDELIEQYKGIKPIISYKDRVAIIEHIDCVDKAIKQTKVVDINQFKARADLFVLGDDWKNNYDHEGINWLRDNNKVVWVPYTKRLSTSSIKEKIINNAIPILKSKYGRK